MLQPSFKMPLLAAAISILFLTLGARAVLNPAFQPVNGKPAFEALRALHTDNRVWMSDHEQSLMESYLAPSDIMLEYGSGFSTLWFSQFVEKFYSIEHNVEWYNAIKSELE
jgi:hypothetical protein